MNTASSPAFRRSRTTWLGYTILGYHTLLQALVSAVVPFLRAELNLNYAQAGLYMSANAAGMVLAGLSGDRLADRFGRRAVLWGAASGTLLGLLCLALGAQTWVTLSGAFLCGYLGSLTMVIVQSLLSDLHGEQRGIAISEANISAGVGSFAAPLLASAAVISGLGWRAAPGVVAGLIGLAALVFRRAPFPPSRPEHAENGRARLSPAFWRLWGVMFLSVSVEWSVIFWSADFLEKIGGLSRAASVSWLGAYFSAAVIGRFAASRLLRRQPVHRLLIAAQGVSAAGILLFWLAPLPAARIAGLFLAGLGIGNLFPLGVVEAVGAAPQAPNLASARATLAAGLAISTAPLFVGVVADRVGIHGAYGLTLILLAASAGLHAARLRHAAA